VVVVMVWTGGELTTELTTVVWATVVWATVVVS
jgi:hypothetical protein